MKASKVLMFILLGLFFALIGSITAAAFCSGYPNADCDDTYNNHYYFGTNCLYFPCTGFYNYQPNYYYRPVYTYWYRPISFFGLFRPTYNYYSPFYGNYYNGYNNYYGYNYGGYGWRW